MINNFLTKTSIAITMSMFLLPSIVHAQTATSSPQLSASGKLAQSRADKEIDRRVAALNDLISRIGSMSRVSDTLKQGLLHNADSQTQSLTVLKAKVDQDTDSASLKADVTTLAQSYRIYLLVIPQGRISAGADRVANVTAMMEGIGNKLQTRLQAANASGVNVSAAGAALTDLGLKISDARTQAQAAITAIAPLAPDNNDKKITASNNKVLQQAKSELMLAQKDVTLGRKDIATIMSVLLSTNNATSTGGVRAF